VKTLCQQKKSDVVEHIVKPVAPRAQVALAAAVKRDMEAAKGISTKLSAK
jgi:hypothetical protein